MTLLAYGNSSSHDGVAGTVLLDILQSLKAETTRQRSSRKP